MLVKCFKAGYKIRADEGAEELIERARNDGMDFIE
jgi:hypothetical protein